MKTLRFFGMALTAVLLSVGFAACSSDDDDNDEGDGGQDGKVKIYAVPVSKRNAHYNYKLTVRYSGNNAKSCGVYYGPTAGMGRTKTHSGSGTYTFSCDFYTGSTYYYQGFIKTTSGTILKSSKERVRVK